MVEGRRRVRVPFVARESLRTLEGKRALVRKVESVLGVLGIDFFNLGTVGLVTDMVFLSASQCARGGNKMICGVK